MPSPPDYLSRQLITYIGNKRALLAPIASAVQDIARQLNQPTLTLWDAFSGSGVVSRLFKSFAHTMVASDCEDYARVINHCFLRNASTVNAEELQHLVNTLNQQAEGLRQPVGFLEELYSPRNEHEITPEDRVFYTPQNARRLDWYRQQLHTLPDDTRDLLLGPLLAQASVHTNTAGVFKGFYKNRTTGTGQFGGTGTDALTRIRGTIQLEVPVLSEHECECQVLQGDANTLAKSLKFLDVAYFDPPYNQHPYGSNYFMLNLLVNYVRPKEISRVSGIPTDWQRSGYNVKAKAAALFEELIKAVDAKFVLVSFNNEGFVKPEQMREMLAKVGRVTVMELPYNTFRGSRNLRNRSIHVVEQLFVVEKR